jgi:lauroyl/myristoyl acyltransferase
MSQDEIYQSWGSNPFNTGFVFRLSAAVCKLFPRGALYATAENIFDWYQAWNLETTAAVTDNLAKAFPERSREVVESYASRTFTNYAHAAVDYLRAGDDPPVVRHGNADVQSLLDAAGGEILVTAHMGSWEIGGRHVGKSSKRYVLVGLPERDERLGDFRESWRSGSGPRTLMAGRGLSTPFALRGALEAGDNVVVLVDRAVGRDRVEVAFRGRRSFFLKSPALFSALTGAPVRPVAVMREGPGQYAAYAGEPLAVPPEGGGLQKVMQRAADFFGDILERYPDQWYNFFRYWQEAP